jgi:hypothetical protein
MSRKPYRKRLDSNGCTILYNDSKLLFKNMLDLRYSCSYHLSREVGFFLENVRLSFANKNFETTDLVLLNSYYIDIKLLFKYLCKKGKKNNSEHSSLDFHDFLIKKN